MQAACRSDSGANRSRAQRVSEMCHDRSICRPSQELLIPRLAPFLYPCNPCNPWTHLSRVVSASTVTAEIQFALALLSCRRGGRHAPGLRSRRRRLVTQPAVERANFTGSWQMVAARSGSPTQNTPVTEMTFVIDHAADQIRLDMTTAGRTHLRHLSDCRGAEGAGGPAQRRRTTRLLGRHSPRSSSGAAPSAGRRSRHASRSRSVRMDRK